MASFLLPNVSTAAATMASNRAPLRSSLPSGDSLPASNRNHGSTGMAFQNSRHRVQTAQKWLDTMVREEIASTGANKVVAIKAVARRIGVTAAFIEHIERGRAKTVDADKFELVREGFCASLEHKAMSLMHEAQMAQQTGAGADRMIEIETCLRRMLEEIARGAARIGRAVRGVAE